MAAEASDAGQHSMEHLLGVLVGCSSRESELVRDAVLAAEKRDPAPFFAHLRTAATARDTYDDAKAKVLFARFVRNGTWQAPTLVLGRICEFLSDGSFPDKAWLNYVPRSVRKRWEENPAFGKPTPEDIALGKKVFRYNLELVGKMHKAGVRILAGTDSSFPCMITDSACMTSSHCW